MSAYPVLIVGAGPTGLALALFLAHHGVPFRIIDKNSGPGQASRAMVVHARTLEFYQQLGFAQEVVDQGIPVETMRFRSGAEEIARLQFKDIGEGLSPFPFLLCYPQDDHERFLGEKLKDAGIEIEWQTELKEFKADENEVRAVLAKGDAEETCIVDYLCGCDGARSQVRRGLELDFPGGTYDQIFYVADVKIEGGQDRDFIGHIGQHSLAIMLPIRSSGMERIIGIVPDELTGRENITFEDLRGSVEELIGVRVEQVNWFSTYHVHHRVAAHFRVGRVFIAGDAGHIHSPAGGQGMNTGIGDAVNLSWKLASVIQGKADASLLDSYEPERISFARLLVSTTDRAFTTMVGKGLPNQFLRTQLLPHLVPFLTGFSTVRHAIFNTVSQTRITYHESPLSEGHVGGVHGGDRLPWVSSPAYDNFAPLASLDWQIHIYGEVSPALRDAATDLKLDIQSFAWTEEASHAGLERNALYLIRPDGYVALALSHQDRDKLKQFVERVGLQR